MTRFLCRLHFGYSEGGHSPLTNQFFNASLVGGRPAILIFSRGELSTIAVLVQTLNNAADSPLAEGFFDGLFVVQGRFFGPLFVEYQPNLSEFMVGLRASQRRHSSLLCTRTCLIKNVLRRRMN